MCVRAVILLLVALLCGLAAGGYIPPGPKYRCPEQKLLLHPCTCETESDVGISVRCENTNLASMSIGLQNLATFKLPIETLTLHKCHIARLFGSLLYKLKLRILVIEDTPLEKIEEYSFLGVNNTLNELYVYNSILKEFPKEAFQILGNLTIMKLDGHRITTLQKDAFFDTELAGKLLRLQISNGNLSDLLVESLQPLRKLKYLDLHGNQLKTLKKNQFKGLRDTEVLDLSHNKITKIDGSHLADLTKLGFFNVSHNEITELSRGAFARNAVLKLLNMSHNKIRKLDSNSFRGMRFLRRLFLSDNAISDVGRGTFASIGRIGTIDLARNSIKKIDYQMFHQLNFIEVLDVSENNVTEIQKGALKDLFLTNINFSHNAIASIENGAFVNCANMTILDLSYNNLKMLPKKTFDETTYASELNMAFNYLTELNQIPLHNMTGLKILNVTYNMLTKIPRHTFPKLYELHTIDLSHNNISEIFNAVFQTLFSIRILDLSYNSLETIKPSTFGPIPTMLDLDLSYNRIRDMSKGALARMGGMRQLKMSGNELHTLFILPISVAHLDLSRNKFEKIPPKLWPSMNSLLSLDLSWNQLSEGLESESFKGLLTLQRLNLGYNGIKKAPWAALGDLSSLQYVYMEGNNLTKLDKAAFGRMPVLFELNLANNQLNNISARAFEGLIQMIVLNLSNNNISHIHAEAMKGLVALRELDLSYNRIERIDNKTHGLLMDCLSLEKLDLSHNKISFINRKTFPNEPYTPYRLREIDLSYNSLPVITYDIRFGTSKVEKLNVSHNNIADLRRGALGNLTMLRELDLSFNNLEDITSELESFRLPKNMSRLHLSHNQLSLLPWTHIKNVTKLELLDISYNNFERFDNNLTDLVLHNTNVVFEGNPLICDCFTRPLRRYINKQLHVKQIYKDISCFGPPYLDELFLHEVPDDRLTCPGNVNISRIMESEPGEYDITPDFRFRSFQIKNNQIKVKWLVVKNEDIGDPYIIIQNTRQPDKLLYENTLPYFKRSVEIDVANLSASEEVAPLDFSEFQLCVLARDSRAFVRNNYKEQCKDLPPVLAFAHPLRNSVILTITTLILNLYYFIL
ncbi:PREDICTED: insulin-like growth factor-binding protein complex acid labile subunit isoform X1 [Nicrophorus vespilloides]|uniref:Insulin-like growth factor-binding protein complex acid labile subunit isoform X1 n=1 Tax=Nicrophorus vespilloides TaxID=110193 RepID=A0ABM1M1B5_NICVS|nr:PREDICTED: insulin-like growth factor-binding protein complex acid labile subunit isoform X1 [Nicrophorus vespilloides]